MSFKTVEAPSVKHKTDIRKKTQDCRSPDASAIGGFPLIALASQNLRLLFPLLYVFLYLPSKLCPKQMILSQLEFKENPIIVLIILISIVFNMQSPPPGENCQCFHNCHVFLLQHPRYHHLQNRSSSNVPNIASTLGHPRNYQSSRINPSTP